MCNNRIVKSAIKIIQYTTIATKKDLELTIKLSTKKINNNESHWFSICNSYSLAPSTHNKYHEYIIQQDKDILFVECIYHYFIHPIKSTHAVTVVAPPLQRALNTVKGFMSIINKMVY